MDKKQKFLVGILVAGFIALIYWAVVTVPHPQPETPQEQPTTMSYDGNTISEEQGGRKIWDLTAEHIDVDINTQDASMENIEGHFYQEDGRTVTIHADKGNYAHDSRDITLEGNIDVTTSDGAELSSDQLKWTAAESMLSAIGNAKASKDDMSATGDQFDSINGFADYSITGNAYVAKEDMEASGDRIESSNNFNHFKIIGNAHLAKGENSNENQ